jgi:hypothetical protein
VVMVVVVVVTLAQVLTPWGGVVVAEWLGVVAVQVEDWVVVALHGQVQTRLVQPSPGPQSGSRQVAHSPHREVHQDAQTLLQDTQTQGVEDQWALHVLLSQVMEVLMASV